MTQEKPESERLSVLEERLAGRDIALALQAKEYERRLIDLNHAHDKQVQDQVTYVPREKYEVFERQVREDLATLKGRSQGVGSSQDFIFKVLPILLSLAAFAAMLWRSG